MKRYAWRSLLLLSLAGITSGCQKEVQTPKVYWADTVAKVTRVEKTEPHHYTCVLTYDAPESTAISAHGHEVKHHFQQVLNLDRKPVVHQELRIKYRTDEPVIIKKLEGMQFEK